MAREWAQRHMRHVALASLLLCSVTGSALAIVGAGESSRAGTTNHIVMIVSTRGSLCTGTALAADLILTAGHCVAPQASYRILTSDKKPPGIAVQTIVVNPRYNPKDYASGRVTADVALLKLASPLSSDVRPTTLGTPGPVSPGDRFVIAGYGTTAYGSEAGIGSPRSAALIATGKPGNLQIRLVDPVARGERNGLGGCTGDSGGPAFADSGGVLAVIGVISWSTGPSLSEGCGGMTGITPLSLHRAWITETATKLGSPIAP